MRHYKLGKSSVRGKFVSVSSEFTEVDEKTFFKEIEGSLIFNKLEKHRKDANLIKNLKKGVTLGSNFFIIEDKK